MPEALVSHLLIARIAVRPRLRTPITPITPWPAGLDEVDHVHTFPMRVLRCSRSWILKMPDALPHPGNPYLKAVSEFLSPTRPDGTDLKPLSINSSAVIDLNPGSGAVSSGPSAPSKIFTLTG